MLLILFANSSPLSEIHGPHQASAVVNYGLEITWENTSKELLEKESYSAWHSFSIPRLLYSCMCFVLCASAVKLQWR